MSRIGEQEIVTGAPININMEPSQALEQMKSFIDLKKEQLTSVAANMQQNAEELETNVSTMKQGLDKLQDAKKDLETKIIQKEEQLSKVDSENTQKVQELQKELDKLKEGKSSVDSEMTVKLNKISDLEQQLRDEKAQWNQTKSQIVQQLINFQTNELEPYFINLEQVMFNTNSKIESANETLKSYMIGINESSFGKLREMFMEKNMERLTMFGQQKMYFGKEEEEGEGEMYFGNQEEEEGEGEMYFGNEEEEGEGEMYFGNQEEEEGEGEMYFGNEEGEGEEEEEEESEFGSIDDYESEDED